jgi:hypothetical protein
MTSHWVLTLFFVIAGAGASIWLVISLMTGKTLLMMLSVRRPIFADRRRGAGERILYWFMMATLAGVIIWSLLELTGQLPN